MTETAEKPKYLDVRQDFWRETFAGALDYDAYLAAGQEKHRSKWQAMAPKIGLSDSLTARVADFKRQLNVVVYSGIWCGDCVRQGPILQQIAEASDSIDLRFVERDDASRLSDELRINGALKVPVVVFLSEDFYEIGRVGDRMLSTYRRKAERDVGATCDTGLVPPQEQELAVETGEWVDEFERIYWIVRLSPMLRERHGD